MAHSWHLSAHISWARHKLLGNFGVQEKKEMAVRCSPCRDCRRIFPASLPSSSRRLHARASCCLSWLTLSSWGVLFIAFNVLQATKKISLQFSWRRKREERERKNSIHSVSTQFLDRQLYQMHPLDYDAKAQTAICPEPFPLTKVLITRTFTVSSHFFWLIFHSGWSANTRRQKRSMRGMTIKKRILLLCQQPFFANWTAVWEHCPPIN